MVWIVARAAAASDATMFNVDISSRSSIGQPPEIRMTVLSPRTCASAASDCRRAEMLVHDVMRTDRQVLSACIWSSLVQDPLPPDPKLLLRGAGAAGAGEAGAGEADGDGDDPLLSPLAPPDGGADGVATGDPVPADGATGAAHPPADAVPHSRSPTERSAIMLRLVMSLASARLPYSQPASGRLMPVTRCSPCCTLSCAHVNEMFGPTGSSDSAVRSE